jgi:hypothetical protein
VSARTFKGKLASGKPVYVRRTKGDTSGARIALAVYADVRGGGMTLVVRFHDPPLPEDRHMRCDNGDEHEGSCYWVSEAGPMTPAEAARWNAHWWRHVARTAAEVVELEPVGCSC